MRELPGIIVLHYMCHPPSRYRIWFYYDCALPTILLWLDVELLFCVCGGSSILLSMVVQQLVVIFMLLKEEMSTCSSASPSWTRRPYYFHSSTCWCGVSHWLINKSSSSFWSWCVILLKYLCIWFACILSRRFASMFISDIGLKFSLFCGIFTGFGIRVMVIS